MVGNVEEKESLHVVVLVRKFSFSLGLEFCPFNVLLCFVFSVDVEDWIFYLAFH